jgi:hypothetical protein
LRCKFCSFEPQPKKIPDEMVSELRQHVWWQHAKEWNQIEYYLKNTELKRNFTPFEDTYDRKNIHPVVGGISNGRHGSWRKSP